MRDEWVREHLTALVARRIEQGRLTCAELAEKTGLSRELIRRVGERRLRPSLAALQKLAKKLGVDLGAEEQVFERELRQECVRQFVRIWEGLSAVQRKAFGVWADLGADGQEALRKLWSWMQERANRQEETRLPSEGEWAAEPSHAGYEVWQGLKEADRESLLNLKELDFMQSAIFECWRKAVGRAEDDLWRLVRGDRTGDPEGPARARGERD